MSDFPPPISLPSAVARNALHVPIKGPVGQNQPRLSNVQIPVQHARSYDEKNDLFNQITWARMVWEHEEEKQIRSMKW